MTLIVLDTSPCVADYRATDPNYWDPCSTTYPTCSISNTDDDFEGPCMFHENIISQDCTTQYNWLKDVLTSVPIGDWKVVVGHHPVDEIDVMDFTSLLQTWVANITFDHEVISKWSQSYYSYGFDLYLNGHSHTLSQYTIDNTGYYMTTGAGSLVNTVSQTHKKTERKVNGESFETSLGHSYQTLWNSKTAGFTLHTFDSTFSKLTTQFISYTGAVLHTFTVTKWVTGDNVVLLSRFASFSWFYYHLITTYFRVYSMVSCLHAFKR